MMFRETGKKRACQAGGREEGRVGETKGGREQDGRRTQDSIPRNFKEGRVSVYTAVPGVPQRVFHGIDAVLVEIVPWQGRKCIGLRRRRRRAIDSRATALFVSHMQGVARPPL
jgi:hypothetical protein